MCSFMQMFAGDIWKTGAGAESVSLSPLMLKQVHQLENTTYISVKKHMRACLKKVNAALVLRARLYREPPQRRKTTEKPASNTKHIMTVPISLEGRTENVSSCFMFLQLHAQRHPNSCIMEEEIITLTMSVWNVFRKSEEQECIRCLLASRQGAISTFYRTLSGFRTHVCGLWTL